MKTQTAHGRQTHIAQDEDEVQFGNITIAFREDEVCILISPRHHRTTNQLVVVPDGRNEIIVKAVKS